MNEWSRWTERAVEGEKPRPGVMKGALRVYARPRKGSIVRGSRRFYVQEFSSIDLFGSGKMSPSQFEVQELEPVYTRRPNRRIIAWRQRTHRRTFKTEARALAFVDTFRK